jgi:hypothetical protein
MFAVNDTTDVNDSLAATAARLAALLTGEGQWLADPSRTDLVFEPSLEVLPLHRGTAPPDVWAVDGGQGLVADARCLQVYVTRAARVRWQDGRSTVEEEGPLRTWLLGLGEERSALAALVRAGAPFPPDTVVDVNLLREWGEWSMASACVSEAGRGALVLVDGDLQPDRRIPVAWLAELMSAASTRGVTLAGVTKHSSLALGGAPLLGVLERMAAASLGPRACWWAPVARTRSDAGGGPGVRVVVARLDSDARFAFRVDLPDNGLVEPALAGLSALCDDAAFPGYPFPLSLADRLAACSPWLRGEVWDQIQAGLDRAGVAVEVQERAFADRHRLMERG